MKTHVIYYVEKKNAGFNFFNYQGVCTAIVGSKAFRNKKRMEKFMKKIGGSFTVMRRSFKKNHNYWTEFYYIYPVQKEITDFIKKHVIYDEEF